MLFKRYNDVSFLLSTMGMSEFFEFITVMLEEMQEEKIWYMWNHLAFREEEYQDFKKRILDQLKTPAEKKAERDKEEQKGIEISNKILGWEGEANGIV